MGSFSYTSHAGFVFYLGLHFYVGSFSYTSRAGFIFIWGASLTHPVLVYFFYFFLSGEFLLHIPCGLHDYVRSFSYTSRVLGSFFYASNAGFTSMWGVSLTHPVLVSFLRGEFHLHIPSSGELLLRIQCWFHFYLGSFSDTSGAGFILCGEFLLHIPCLLPFYLGSFSYTSHAGFIFYLGLHLCGEFLLHIPCWLHSYLGSCSYTSRAGLVFLFIWGVALTHLVQVSCLYGEFLLHIPSSGELLLRIQCWFHFYLGSFSYTSRAGFILCGEFLLRIPCLLPFYLGSFSYTSHAGFIFIRGCIFMWGVSLTHPVLASFLSGEFLLHIPCWITFLSGEFLLHTPCWLHVYVRSFSYTSRVPGIFFYTSNAGSTFIWGVSLTHPVLASFLSGSFSYTSQDCFIFLSRVLLQIPRWLYSFSGEFLLHIPF